MKKFILLFLGIVLLAGCSNNAEKELCDKIDEIDVMSFTEENNYEELTSVLENNYKTYCENSTTEICNTLNDYIKSSKSEIKIEDCSNLEGSWKGLCESDNKLANSSKAINVNYMHEKMWAVCNE